MKDYQERQKFFYAIPELFPEWDYPSRLAIGIKLSDAYYRNAPFFRFKIRDVIYQISREKAFELGSRYVLKAGTLPNLIPVEEFEIIKRSENTN